MNSVTKRIDEVAAITSKLRDIRTRLGQIDEERATLEAHAEKLLGFLAARAAQQQRPSRHDQVEDANAVMPGMMTFVRLATDRLSLTDKIISVLDANPTSELGATDLAAALGLSGESSTNTIRGTLSRLNAEGRIRKTGFGKYVSLKGGKNNAPPAANG